MNKQISMSFALFGNNHIWLRDAVLGNIQPSCRILLNLISLELLALSHYDVPTLVMIPAAEEPDVPIPNFYGCLYQSVQVGATGEVIDVGYLLKPMLGQGEL
ncbi:hypothetical protein Tco_1143170 [Tanacetum coccineum]